MLAFGMLPALALVIAAGAGFLKWQDGWVRGSRVAGIESVAAAKDSTIALLSYQPDTVDKELKAARDRLTGSFKDSYTQLIQDVVIPGAKKQHISAVATVPAAASVSATPKHAVALLYVDQTVVVGNDAPTDTSSIVRVTLDRTGGRWLISAFDPI
jgi:Mce-associated membrane protein